MPEVSGATTYPLLWTIRGCADYMGFSPEWVRVAVVAGVTVNGGRRVRLEAETIALGSRCIYRIHIDQFIEFLRALGWRRLPAGSFAHSNN